MKCSTFSVKRLASHSLSFCEPGKPQKKRVFMVCRSSHSQAVQAFLDRWPEPFLHMSRHTPGATALRVSAGAMIFTCLPGRHRQLWTRYRQGCTLSLSQSDSETVASLLLTAHLLLHIQGESLGAVPLQLHNNLGGL